MKLAKLLKNVCFTGDYIDVVNMNLYPIETIRINGDMLNEIHDTVFNSVPYSKDWTLVQYLMKSENKKLAEWLVKEINYIDMKKNQIILDDGIKIGE